MKYRLNEPALFRLLEEYPQLDRDVACDAIFRCLDGRGPATRYQEEIWLAYVAACSEPVGDDEED